MARSRSRWVRNRSRSDFRRLPQLKRILRGRVALEQLEARLVLSTTTYPVDSSSPAAIPLGDVKPGQTVTIQVNFNTTDNVNPNDRTENEPLIIEGPGFSQTIYSYGTQSFKVPVSQKGEQLTAYIQDADGDESGSIAVGDRIVQVKMDLAALAAPWLSLEKDLQQSEEAIETILKAAPGWQFYPPDLKIDPKGEISGQVSVAPDDTIDGGEVSISGGIELSSTTELYWGLPAHLFGVSGSLKGALGASVEAKADWDSNGKVTFGGDLKAEGSLTLAGNLYALFFRGSISGQAGIELPSITVSPDGTVKSEVEAKGQVAATIEYKGLTDKNYATLLSVSRVFGPYHVGEFEVNLSDLVEQAVKLAEGDPLVVTSQPPSNLTDGAPIGLTVTAENPDGSVNTSFNGPVSVALNNYYGYTGTLGGTATATAVNGVATFSGLSVTGPDNPYYYLSVSGNGFPTTFTNYFSVNQPANHLALSYFPSNVLANGPFSLEVYAEDSAGSVDRTYNGPVTLSLGSDPAGGALGGVVTTTAYHGVAYFYGLTIDTPGSGYTLQASSSGLTSATTPAFDVNDQLVITTQPPSNLTDGSTFDLVATVEDGQGRAVTSYNGDVTVTLNSYYVSGGALGGTATVTAVNGVAAFSGLSVTGPDSPYYYLTVSANGVPTTSASTREFGLTQPASQLALSYLPNNVLANTSFNMEVYAEDASGNIDRTFNGPITLSLGSDPAGGALGGAVTATAYNGIAYFYGLTIDTPGSGYALQASSGGTTSAISSPFEVYGGQLAVWTQPPQVVRVGTGFGMVVTVEDTLGNVDTSYNGSVTVGLAYGYGTLGGVLTATAVNGVATFTDLTLDQGGYFQLAVTAPGRLSATTNYFQATTAAPATQLVVSAPYSYQGNIFTNAPFDLTVQAEDANGKVDPAFNGTMTLSLGNNPAGGALSGTLTATFYYGVASLYGVTIDKAGNGYTLLASATGLISGTSSNFNVYVGQLVITTPPPSQITAGSSFGLVVSAENYQTGAVDTSFNGAVTLQLGNLNGGLDNLLNGTLTVNAVNGVATFSGLTINQVDGNGFYNIEISSNQAPDTFTTIDVVPGAATQLAVTSQPSGVTAGAGFTLVVSAEDASGNVDPNFNGTVDLALDNNPGGGALSGMLTATAVNGVATFSGVAINNQGSGYTLQATSANLTAATTNGIDVAAPGVATRLVLTTPPPYSVTAGAGFGLVVAAEDDFGTVDTNFAGTVTVSDANGNLLGQVRAVNGVATFSGLTLDTVSYPYGPNSGAYPVTLNVRSNGLPTVHGSVTVEPGTAAALFVQSPYNAKNGNTIVSGSSFNVVVNVDDAHGNIDSNFYGNVTIALGDTSAGGALSGALTVYAYAGVATFTGLSINDAGSYSLQASASGLSSGNSADFDVVTDQLIVASQPPSTVTAGVGFGVVVDVANAQGNTDTSFNGNVTVSLLDFNQTGAALGGTLTVQAVNGVATFSGLTLSMPGSYALSMTSSGMGGTVSGLFNVTPVPTQLAVTSQPPSVITAGAGFVVDVSIEDARGNVVTNYNGGVTLALADNPGGATLGGTLTATAVNGVASFTGLTIDAPGSGYKLEASANGLTSALTSPIDVSSVGQATQFVVTSQPPSSVSAGTGFGLTVQAEDSLGNVDTSFNKTVVVDDPFGNSLGQTTAVNGVATFTGLTVEHVGSMSLTVTGDGLNATTNLINITAPPATQLGIAALATNVLTGSHFSLTVVAFDPFGNVDSGYSGSVTLSLSSSPGGNLGGTLTGTAVNGVATFSDLTISAPGEGYVIQAASPGLSSFSTLPFDVTNDQLVVTSPPPANVTAGSGFGLAVAAETSSGSVDSSFDGSVTLLLTDPLGNPGDLGKTVTIAAVDGIANFAGLKIDQAGSYTITAGSDNGVAPVTTAITVVPAAATKLVVTGEPPAALTAGADFTVTIAAEDANGNVDSTFDGSVTIALANNSPADALGGMLTVTAVNGVAIFTGLSVNNPGSGFALQATAANVASATTSDFDVTSPGLAAQLVLTSQPPSSVNAGAGFDLVVSAEDGFGTVDRSFDGMVAIINPNGGGLLAQTAAVNGVAAFTGLMLDQAGQYALTVTANGLTQATTDTLTVNALAASALTVVGPLQDVVPNSPFEVAVEATDQYGNVDPTFNGSVILSLLNGTGGATLSGATLVTAAHGLAEFTGLAIDQTGTGYTVSATSSGLAAGTSSPFDVTQDQLVASSQPPSILSTNSSFGFIVAAQNATGIVDTSFNGVVTVALFEGANDGALVGTLTAMATNGVATFSGLSVTQPGLYQLEATSNGVGGVVTDLITLVRAPAKVSGVAVDWGSQTAQLRTASDGVRLLPATRSTDLPWDNVDKIAVTLDEAAALAPSDVRVTGIAGGDYGPVTISGSGTSYIITLAKPVAAADRLTLMISNAQIADFTRRIDVLPGDVNDDGAVNTTDGVLILYHPTPAHPYSIFYDLNGDGAVNMTDFVLYRPLIGTVLPSLPPQLAAGGEGPGSADRLTQAELSAILPEAIEEWAAAGLPASDIARLDGVKATIMMLPSGYLGGALIGGSTIYLSPDAAGYGWFVDAAPWSDAMTKASVGHEDLLTVVMHELGHVLGLNDLDPAAFPDELMAETLATGVRRLPSVEDVIAVLSAQRPVSSLSPTRGHMEDAFFAAERPAGFAGPLFANIGPKANSVVAVSEPDRITNYLAAEVAGKQNVKTRCNAVRDALFSMDD